MADEVKRKPDFYANRAIGHFAPYFGPRGRVDSKGLTEKEGLNEKQIAELAELMHVPADDEPKPPVEAEVETEEAGKKKKGK
jgi:hypothetical protein